MRVVVWDTPEPQIALEQGRYVTRLLRSLGYEARLRLLPTAAFLRYTNTPRNRAQVVSGGWSAEFPAASDFIGKLTCANFVPRSVDASQLCDRALDRRIAKASTLQAVHPQRASALWARLDRDLTRRAVWLPTVTPKVTDVVSRRVGNYQYHVLWGALVDQIWVR